MKSTQKQGVFYAILAATFVVANIAQAVPITFQVRMAQQILLGNFDPDTEFVDLAGTFNGWGTSPLTPLADADGDSIYTVVVDGFTPDEFIEYKFRYNGQWDGTEEFPGFGSNRFYTVLAAENLIDVWYNDFPPGSGGGGTGELHWWNDTVFYEILVRSFQDSDGDGIGDLQGLTQRLDYLNDGDPNTTDDLGITGIWLMPINDSPSYHGYDAVDYRAINSDYGTMADFEAFLAAAHARGIKVIIDYVMNHCSDQHPWFTAAAANDPTYRDWFRWSPSDPGQTGPWGQNVWHWNASGWFYGLFWGGMPDLNYDSPALKTEMFDTAAWWLETIGVDGFRLDAVLYIDEDGGQLQNTPGTLQFWQDFNTLIKASNPEALSVGEAWTATNNVLPYVTNDRLDLCFEFDLSYATVGAVNNADADYLAGKASQVYGQYPYQQFATFLTNHDQDRLLNVVGFDEGKAKAAAGIYLTLPGVPFVYYGEEIGMVGSGAHEFIRSPMQWTDGTHAGFTPGSPWQAINTNYPQFNVAIENQDGGSLLSWYKRLITLRNGTPALRRGTLEMLTVSEPSILAFVREYEQQRVLCLANTSPNTRTGVTVTGSASNLLPGAQTFLNLLDPADSLEVVVGPSFDITGLILTGHEVAVYQLAVATSGDDDGLPRTGIRLEPAFPNPFNPATTIRYTLPEPSWVRLSVFDLAGREVAVLRDGTEDTGPHVAQWQGTDNRGAMMGAGVYFVRLVAGSETRTTDVVLVK